MLNVPLKARMRLFSLSVMDEVFRGVAFFPLPGGIPTRRYSSMKSIQCFLSAETLSIRSRHCSPSPQTASSPTDALPPFIVFSFPVSLVYSNLIKAAYRLHLFEDWVQCPLFFSYPNCLSKPGRRLRSRGL